MIGLSNVSSNTKATTKMKIGITGSRQGFTLQQYVALENLLVRLDGRVLLHGDCVGVDGDTHDLAYALGYDIHVYPPSDDKLRAFKTGDMSFPPKPYLDRNRDIVNDCDILIGVPRVGSRGTMYTIKYGVDQGKDVRMIEEDGTVIHM